jgi:colanic acid biosynthesis protein WcaH
MEVLQPKRLSQEEFEKSFENVPRVAVNLIVTDIDGRVLLARRNIPPHEGDWHFPGSFVLKNESISEALKRVAKNEFGMELTEEMDLKLLGNFDDIEGDPRGHVIDMAYGVQISDVSKIVATKENIEVGFFDKLPENIGFNHRDTLEKLGYR